MKGKPLKVEIPVGFKGKAQGVKDGGSLISLMRKINVQGLPADLTDKLYIDITDLELGSSVRVSDIELPAGVKFMTDEATPVAMIEVPRALKSAEAADAENEEGTEAAGGEEAASKDEGGGAE